MLGYTQEMLVPANEAKIEARDAGTTTTRRRQLTSEFSYSPEVGLWETGFGISGSLGQLPIRPTRSTGRRNTIKSLDPTILPLENRTVRVYSIRPKQGGVAFESMLANDFGF